MEATNYKTQNCEMIEVEIYETGEKTQISSKKQITNQKNILDRSIIITAAQYENYKADILNNDM